jgi:hypothetical protein
MASRSENKRDHNSVHGQAIISLIHGLGMTNATRLLLSPSKRVAMETYGHIKLDGTPKRSVSEHSLR